MIFILPRTNGSKMKSACSIMSFCSSVKKTCTYIKNMYFCSSVKKARPVPTVKICASVKNVTNFSVK